MKNLVLQPVDTYTEETFNLLTSLFVDKTTEFNATEADFGRMKDNAGWAKPLYFQHKTGHLVLNHGRFADMLTRIQKDIPHVRFATRAPDADDAWSKVILIQYADEPFYRAAVNFYPNTDFFSVCSAHINTVNLSRRSRGSISGVKGSSGTNTVARSTKLKNYEREVVAILRGVCKQPAASIVTFEDMCFKAQSYAVNNISIGTGTVRADILERIGRDSRWNKVCLSDDVRVAAFLALEYVLRGTKAFVIDEGTRAEFMVALHGLDSVREGVDVSLGKIPIQIIKIRGLDGFVLKRDGNYKRVAQLPDVVVPQVATLMAIGEGEVYGVGVTGRTNAALEINMVVMVEMSANI